MGYKWKPSKAQQKAFAEKMKNPEDKAEYEARKKARADKRRADSKFDYNTAGGYYVPTKAQHDYCVFNRPAALTSDQEDACNIVATGYACNQKVHHDYIHVVNELIRQQSTY